MAKRHYSAYQKGVIKRYYENKDTLMRQKLGEMISDLYLADTHAKRERLWKRVEKALVGAGVEQKLVQAIVGERSLEGLAEVVAEIF